MTFKNQSIVVLQRLSRTQQVFFYVWNIKDIRSDLLPVGVMITTEPCPSTFMTSHFSSFIIEELAFIKSLNKLTLVIIWLVQPLSISHDSLLFFVVVQEATNKCSSFSNCYWHLATWASCPCWFGSWWFPLFLQIFSAWPNWLQALHLTLGLHQQ